MLIVFLALLVFDVVMVVLTTSGFLTISKIVLHATPRFVVMIWIFGIVTGNIFFPRSQPELKLRRTVRLVILIFFGFGFLALGHRVDQMSSGLQCSTHTRGNGFVWSFLRAECISCNSTNNMNFVPCIQANDDECRATVNFSTDANLCIFLFGMFCGFVFWPQVPDSGADSKQFLLT